MQEICITIEEDEAPLLFIIMKGVKGMASFGQHALVSIMTHLIFIALTWWTLQGVNIEKILKPNRVVQARIFYILLTIAIGSTVSNFFLDYLSWSRQLPFIFRGE
jgi:uncharacterized integral membrane protein (TIGR02327 family)